MKTAVTKKNAVGSEYRLALITIEPLTKRQFIATFQEAPSPGQAETVW
jgi:hypothetical protein